MHTTDVTIPIAIIVKIRVVKYCLASLRLPSPKARAISALPPVPSIKPKAPTKVVSGKIIFTEEIALLPTKFETNIQSTTLYIDVNTIIIIDGKVNLSNLL